jgi:hypothetical protein
MKISTKSLWIGVVAELLPATALGVMKTEDY